MAIAVYDPILFGDTSGDLGLRSRAAGQHIGVHELTPDDLTLT